MPTPSLLTTSSVESINDRGTIRTVIRRIIRKKKKCLTVVSRSSAANLSSCDTQAFSKASWRLIKFSTSSIEALKSAKDPKWTKSNFVQQFYLKHLTTDTYAQLQRKKIGFLAEQPLFCHCGVPSELINFQDWNKTWVEALSDVYTLWGSSLRGCF